MIRRAALAAALLVMLSATGAMAATKTVSIYATKYSPANIKIAMGGSIQWTNTTAKAHTVSSDASFLATLFFPNKTVNAHTTSAPMAFPYAGTFLYHDTNANLHGSVKVPMKIDQTFLSLGNTATLTLGTVAIPTTQPDAHIVVASLNGGAWSTIVQTHATTATWKPFQAGTWTLKTCITHALGGGSSGYSPILTVTVS